MTHKIFFYLNIIKRFKLIEFNKRNTTIAIPDTGSDPPNPNGVVVRAAGCQMICMRYQKIDSFLEENEQFFNQAGTAFVLKPQNLRYVNVVIPPPTPQNPAVSFAPVTIQATPYNNITV